MATKRSDDPNPKAQVMGQAIANLRERAGITQPQAARKVGITRQAFGNYERGLRDVVLREDVLADIARALDLAPEDILRERDRLLGAPPPQVQTGQVYQLHVQGRVRSGAEGPEVFDLGQPDSVVDVAWMFGPAARTLRVAGDAMTGYVESGQLVIYDQGQWPRRGDGCVVELRTGEVYVREYVETGPGLLKVRQRFPDEVRSFPMSEIKGVYTIRFRGL